MDSVIALQRPLAFSPSPIIRRHRISHERRRRASEVEGISPGRAISASFAATGGNPRQR